MNVTDQISALDSAVVETQNVFSSDFRLPNWSLAGNEAVGRFTWWHLAVSVLCLLLMDTTKSNNTLWWNKGKGSKLTNSQSLRKLTVEPRAQPKDKHQALA